MIGAVAPLRHVRDEDRFGGKAVQLGVAVRGGLPVPDGVALASDLVEALAAGERDAERSAAEPAVALGRPLAVRSSAVGEDSMAATFAGQHATRLNVRGADAVVTAVRAVRDSAHAPPASAYRERLGIKRAVRIGVVLQVLVEADRAGVMFTCDPVSGGDDTIIESGWGLGVAVVAGRVIPDSFRLSRAGAVLQRAAGIKEVAIRAAGTNGVAEHALSGAEARRMCLDDRDLGQLHELRHRCEEVFGPRRDVEWAFAGADLFLLQCRAVAHGGSRAL